ncbi:MAG: hypothetical protein KGL12_17190, partial [Rhodospirillales bacterium]|nr:hypothetical protein [Rhodospirillales bacterium]
MRHDTIRFRLCAAVAMGALGYATVIPLWTRPAQAEVPLPAALMPAPQYAPSPGSAPQPGVAPGTPGAQAPLDNGADPPARVGRLADFSGAVSYHSASATEWVPATVNYPVTSGDSFWTQPGASARIEISNTAVTMAPATEIDVSTLDNQQLQAAEPQGEVYVQVGALAPGETYQLATPRGTVTIATPGQYGIAAGDTDTPTTVTVIAGQAAIAGPGLSMSVGPGQEASITGTDQFAGTIGSATPDAFLGQMLAATAPPPPPAAVAPVVAQMTGAQDLGNYGSWDSTPQYGQVWYPNVAPGWVPYREGHWAYVQPWGWTWVDNDPWGFAPFHYGRWVQVGPRWGWVPGEPVAPGYGGYGYVAPPPVYAPALVAFIGIGVGVAVTAALLSSHSVGWVPLGWREPYRPWYHASPTYIRNVNIRNVNVTRITNITTINRNVTINNFANRQAATVVPAAAMLTSRPVGPAVQHVTPAMLASARPVVGRQPLPPSRATVGITPQNAARLGAVAAPPGAPVRPAVAPGPAIRP